MRVKREEKVVTVNDVTLYGKDYQASFQQQARAVGLPPGKIPMEIAMLLETPTIEQMEKRELFLQESKKQGLAPTPQEVAAEIQKIKDAQQGKGGFDALLAKMGTNLADFENGIATNIAIKRLVDKTVRDFGLMDEKGARRIYDENPDEWADEKRVDLRQILVAVPPGAPPDIVKQLREQAESVRVEVLGKSKATFEKVAKAKSDDLRTKEKGGHFGVVSRRQLLPDLGAVAFTLKKGEVSSPVRSEQGFHILRSEGVQVKKYKFDEVKDKILTRENLNRQNKAVGAMLEKLREAATIVRHIEPSPLPKPVVPAPTAQAPAGSPAGMPPHAMPPQGMPAGMNPHNAAAGMDLSDLPPPSKDNVLPGMRNPHAAGGKHGAAPHPAPGGAKPKLKLGQ